MKGKSTDSFIDRIYQLSVDNLTKTKCMDVILLMGGTGSGKSTFLNMVAGSKLTAQRKNAKWIMVASPQVAIIGHSVSMTFSPNCWEGDGLILYDCAGLNDTRGQQEEIVKSFFIKEIADYAKSFKIILIGDVHSIYGERCGLFKNYFVQLREFIPNFNGATDCSIIITKAQSDLQNVYVVEQFKKCIDLQLDPQRISIMYQPEKKGIYDYSYINFQKIFDSAPSISQNCNLALSSQAKLKLIDVGRDLKQTIIRWSKQFLLSLKIYYLQVISSRLEEKGQQLNNIHEEFVQINNIACSNTPEQFLDFIKTYSVKLSSMYSAQSSCLYQVSYLQKKIEQIIFLKEKINLFDYCVQDWTQLFSVNLTCFKKSSNAAQFEQIYTFTNFLSESFNMDINKPIQNQMHNFLNVPQILQARYSGSKQIQEKLQKHINIQKTFKRSFVVSHLFQSSIPYSGQVIYSDSKFVTGSVQVQNCVCGNWLVRRCLACSHHIRNVYYQKFVEYKKSFPYYGSINYSHQQKVQSEEIIEASKACKVTKFVKQTIKYEGDHNAYCNQHHKCSCEALARIVISARTLIEDLRCFNQIKMVQQEQMPQTYNVKSLEEQFMSAARQFNIQNSRITSMQLTFKEITDKIHNNLSREHFFNAPYKGVTRVNIQKPYSQNTQLKGSHPTKTKIYHSAYVPYSGVVQCKGNQHYSGSVTCQACYDNCGFCNNSLYQTDYEDYVHFSGIAHYSQNVLFRGQEEVHKDIQYNEQASCAGVIKKQVLVSYSGDNQVCCEKKVSVGSGHHDCSSCKMWEKYVNAFKKLLSLKTQIISIIQSNMELLKKIYYHKIEDNVH